MGCGKAAAAEEEQQKFYDERLEILKKVKPEHWDTFLFEVDRLVDAVNDSDLKAIVDATDTVQDSLRHIRRGA